MDLHENDKSPESEMIERPLPRRRTFKGAIASYNDRSISMDVVVRDYSDSGVRLKLKDSNLLPNHFTLFIELDGILVDCEVVWRDGLELGAKFVSKIEERSASRLQILQPTSEPNRKISLRKKYSKY